MNISEKVFSKILKKRGVNFESFKIINIAREKFTGSMENSRWIYTQIGEVERYRPELVIIENCISENEERFTEIIYLLSTLGYIVSFDYFNGEQRGIFNAQRKIGVATLNKKYLEGDGHFYFLSCEIDWANWLDAKKEKIERIKKEAEKKDYLQGFIQLPVSEVFQLVTGIELTKEWAVSFEEISKISNHKIYELIIDCFVTGIESNE